MGGDVASKSRDPHYKWVLPAHEWVLSKKISGKNTKQIWVNDTMQDKKGNSHHTRTIRICRITGGTTFSLVGLGPTHLTEAHKRNNTSHRMRNKGPHHITT